MPMDITIQNTQGRFTDVLLGVKTWIARQRTKRETLCALRNCRDQDLKDIGLMRHDISQAKTASDAAFDLARTAATRAGNW